jgi:benzoate/toluate 1,2-dioxygenase alpha subunit
MSSEHVADEGIYVSILEEWSRRMREIVQKELQRSGK